MADFRRVLPGTLHLPPTRPKGADRYKFAMQEYEFGTATEDMPAIEVIINAKSEMMIFNGVTRATQAYKYHPEDTVLVEVTDVLPNLDMGRHMTVEEAKDEPGDDE